MQKAVDLPRWLSGKEFSCRCRRHRKHVFDPWVGKIPWRRKWQCIPVFLLGKSQRQRSPEAIVHRVTKSQTWLSTHTEGNCSFNNILAHRQTKNQERRKRNTNNLSGTKILMNTKNKLLPSLLVNAFLFQKISLKDIVSGGRPSVAEALQAHASVICLQHPSLPPHSAAEQVSLN